ncbi:MAG: transporter substrate-binding domain-containing protein [Pseudomonadota bacterium]
MAAVALLGLVAASTPARKLEDVEASGVLRVVVYYDNRPFSWEDPKTGEARGIEADLARAVARELGLKPKMLIRIAGESADDDVRSNIWQGPRTGGLKGDVMFHVPTDREFIARNQLAAISNPYHHEQIVIAVRTDMVDAPKLETFETEKVAVQFSTAGHYFLAFARDGKLKTNVSPYIKFDDAADVFFKKEAAGLMGPRSEIEAVLNGKGIDVKFITPEFPETLIGAWNVGIAVHTDGRDVGYAVGRALRKIRGSGEMEKIFNAYGVAYVPPPVRR